MIARLRDPEQRGSERPEIGIPGAQLVSAQFKHKSPALWAAFTALALTLGGCSSIQIQPNLLPGASPPQQTADSSQPPPRVQDCGVLNNSSPREFACNGKVYTSFQLAKLREDWAKNHPDYNSGFFFEN
jgi:hypothetical protein